MPLILDLKEYDLDPSEILTDELLDTYKIYPPKPGTCVLYTGCIVIDSTAMDSQMV